MAIKKQTNLKTRKPQLRKPSTAPIDLVRNPIFGAAMAQQNYDNFIADQQARIAAERGGQAFPPEQATFTPAQQLPQGFQGEIERRNAVIGKFTQGRQMGAPTNQPIPPGGGLGGLTADQAGISPEQRRILDDLMARQAQQPIPPGGGLGGSQDYGIDYIEGGQRYAPMTPTPSQMAQFLQGQQGAMASQYPNQQAPQASQGAQNAMATYNNLLQQGIQRRNTMNQGAMTDFANMQPGMQATQPATAATPKPAMPVAGMGMQQSNSAPRKFSTVSNSPARLG